MHKETSCIGIIILHVKYGVTICKVVDCVLFLFSKIIYNGFDDKIKRNEKIQERSDSMAVIEVKHLSKSFKVKEKEKGLKGSLKSFVKPKYKIVKAVKNVSFSVEKGEMIAFIGPNGAGKSTSIKMMTGILYPDKGSINLHGNSISLLSIGVGFQKKLTGLENLVAKE